MHAAIPREERLPTFRNPTLVIQELDQVMDRFYRHVAVDDIIDDFNQDIEASQQAYNAEIAAFNAQVEAINAFADQLKRDLAAINRMKPNAKQRDKKVAAHNTNVEKHEQMIAALERDKKRLARLEKRLQRESRSSRRAVNRAINDYQAWYRDGKDVAFNKRLSQLYAHLVRQVYQHDPNNRLTPQTAQQLEQVRQMRNDLVTWKKRRNEESPVTMLYIEVILNGQERTNYLLDTGASSVTLSYPMVYALGLEDQLGDEVTVSLAGGNA